MQNTGEHNLKCDASRNDTGHYSEIERQAWKAENTSFNIDVFSTPSNKREDAKQIKTL